MASDWRGSSFPLRNDDTTSRDLPHFLDRVTPEGEFAAIDERDISGELERFAQLMRGHE